MAFEKIRALQYIADTVADLKDIKETRMGADCYVIKEACEYKMMSTGEWIRQVPKAAVEPEDDFVEESTIWSDLQE